MPHLFDYYELKQYRKGEPVAPLYKPVLTLVRTFKGRISTKTRVDIQVGQISSAIETKLYFDDNLNNLDFKSEDIIEDTDGTRYVVTEKASKAGVTPRLAPVRRSITLELDKS